MYQVNDTVTIQGPIPAMQGITGTVHGVSGGNYLVKLDAVPPYELPEGFDRCDLCGELNKGNNYLNHQGFAFEYIP